MINETSSTFFLPNLSEKEPAGNEMSAAPRLNRAYIKIVVSKGTPISCVRKIKNELLELPNPKRAITERYFQYPLGNWRGLHPSLILPSLLLGAPLRAGP